jgi:hypothetical protein
MITALSSFLIQAQDSRIQSIDSLVKTFETPEIILLFSERRDTIDNFTGKRHIQKNSYYFDWVNKELRFIEVYYFEGQKKHYRANIFAKRKNIPFQTRILYTFLKNQLVYVKLTPAQNECLLCFGEYFYSDSELISANEVNLPGQKRDFLCDATFFLDRLKIAKQGDNLRCDFQSASNNLLRQNPQLAKIYRPFQSTCPASSNRNLLRSLGSFVCIRFMGQASRT